MDDDTSPDFALEDLDHSGVLAPQCLPSGLACDVALIAGARGAVKSGLTYWQVAKWVDPEGSGLLKEAVVDAVFDAAGVKYATRHRRKRLAWKHGLIFRDDQGAARLVDSAKAHKIAHVFFAHRKLILERPWRLLKKGWQAYIAQACYKLLDPKNLDLPRSRETVRTVTRYCHTQQRRHHHRAHNATAHRNTVYLNLPPSMLAGVREVLGCMHAYIDVFQGRKRIAMQLPNSYSTVGTELAPKGRLRKIRAVLSRDCLFLSPSRRQGDTQQKIYEVRTRKVGQNKAPLVRTARRTFTFRSVKKSYSATSRRTPMQGLLEALAGVTTRDLAPGTAVGTLM